MKRLLPVCLLLCAGLFAQNYTVVTATQVKNGNTLLTGRLCFQGTDDQANPIPFHIGGGGQAVSRPFCFTLTNGVVQMSSQVPNADLTSPAHIRYTIQAYANSGPPLLTYTLVNVSGSSFNFDAFIPPGSLPVFGASVLTNGVANILQNLLNFQNGTSINALNPSGGIVQFNLGTVAESQITNLVPDLAGKQSTLGFTPENTANKNQLNGYPGLDGSGLLQAAQVPSLPESRVTNLVSDLAGKQSTASKDTANGYAGLDAGTKTKCSEFPVLTGDVTTAGGSCAVVFPNVVSAGTGLKTTANAKGQVTALGTAACSDLSNAAASCSVDTTNATNISSGSLAAGRLTGQSPGFPTLPQVPLLQGRVSTTTSSTVTGVLLSNLLDARSHVLLSATIWGCTSCNYSVVIQCTDVSGNVVSIPSATYSASFGGSPEQNTSAVLLCASQGNDTDVTYTITKNSGVNTIQAYLTAVQIDKF